MNEQWDNRKEISGLLSDIQAANETIQQQLRPYVQEHRYTYPLFQRLAALAEELSEHVSTLLSGPLERNEAKYHLSVLFRTAEAMAETNEMLKAVGRFHPSVPLQALTYALMRLVPTVAAAYGHYESLLIVTPRFQQLSRLWRHAEGG
ncbi:hypothetical protein GK107_01995 [Geobacillus thermoleovorans]|uniref:Uncharacterized protein n=5 Tax=Geobacillus TaxID=129337 RepID=A0A7U9JC65_GEOTM|nr:MULTISPECIES: hypothetical protein [Geobacillus]AEV17809.1 hypothetical protein GTCCBUS3UF5_4860 [Geobacillus thermoleovorans CCB_US3_UF5]AMV09726.1 hypothetical protein GT3570_01905 [Geobacillus thermoleovorans]AUI36505.1 hypothetical protein CWI35_08190 [[Bacillus] caldolyticus]AWO74021.1 hypothetical protein C1N76_05265 [Geobacillus thermoleovorans]ESU72656.1 hypothetical protein T260_06940 [Geobacillus sp. MAS1]